MSICLWRMVLSSARIFERMGSFWKPWSLPDSTGLWIALFWRGRILSPRQNSQDKKCALLLPGGAAGVIFHVEQDQDDLLSDLKRNEINQPGDQLRDLQGGNAQDIENTGARV